MKFEPAMQRYSGALAQAANDALLDGLGPMDVIRTRGNPCGISEISWRDEYRYFPCIPHVC